MINRYRGMASDAVRVGAFRRAIESVVRPGDVVVDVGCGLGTYAVFAARAGARKVYAIEREHIVITARQIARDNGCADRIEFICADALDVKLPERADVAIFEDFSATFVEPETERLIRAVQRRMLKPGGRIIPSTVDVFAAPVHCRALYARIDQWGDTGQKAHGVDFSATREMAMNCIHRAGLRAAELAAMPKRAHHIDFAAKTAFGFDARLSFHARRAAVLHGLAVWFEARLAPRVRLSNSPLAPATLWGQGLLPLVQPVKAGKGSLIAVDLAARPSRDSGRVWWQWAVRTSGGEADGTTFRSFPTTLTALEAGSRTHRPLLSVEAEMVRCALSSLKRGCTILGLARVLRRRFPRWFPTLRNAVSRAGEYALRYGRRPEV